MHKVYLFGSSVTKCVPAEIERHIAAILQETNGDVKFLVGDGSGLDSGYHKSLSALGCRSKTEVYCIDSPYSNTFDLPQKVFKVEHDESDNTFWITEEAENGNWVRVMQLEGIENLEEVKASGQCKGFKNMRLMRDCTFAICLWDGRTRSTLNTIGILKAQNKPVIVYTVQTT